jgi:hypothetical protein
VTDIYKIAQRCPRKHKSKQCFGIKTEHDEKGEQKFFMWEGVCGKPECPKYSADLKYVTVKYCGKNDCPNKPDASNPAVLVTRIDPSDCGPLLCPHKPLVALAA